MGGDQEDHPLSPAGAQVTLELEFRDLSPATADDLFRFFDGPAFADFPAWRSCNCFFYNFTGSQDEWRARTAEQNRLAKADLVRSGRSHGVLAYEGGDVVGWCHADRRENLVALDRWAPKAPGAGVVICFVVRPDRRRQGVAGRLLSEACSLLEWLGCSSALAYPPERTGRPGLPDEQSIYRGTPSMYEATGFERGSPFGPVVEMRRPLGGQSRGR